MSKIKMNNKQNIEIHLIALVRRGANNITKLAITRQTQMGGKHRVNAVQCTSKRRVSIGHKKKQINPVSKQVVGGNPGSAWNGMMEMMGIQQTETPEM